MSLSEVTMEHQTVQTVLTEKFPKQGRVLLHRKEKGLFKNLRTEQSSIHSQAKLQIQEAFILFQSNVEATITSSLKAISTGKLVFCRQWLLEVREVRGEVLECQKAPGKLLGMAFSHKNKLLQPRGKTMYKNSEKGGNILSKYSVRCPSRKILILKWEDFILE